MRRRGTTLLALTVGLAAVVVAGCGRDDFENDPRPPVPNEVSVKISSDQVAVSPREFPAGLVNLSIANLSADPVTLSIDGPVDAETEEIPGITNRILKVELKPGEYEASADGVEAFPFKFTVGPEGESGQNDLLLP